MGQKDWDLELISNTRLEQTEEEFRQRLKHQMSQQRHVAELDILERPRERYFLFEFIEDTSYQRYTCEAIWKYTLK